MTEAKFKQPIGEPILPILQDKTVVLIATGPSINDEQIRQVFKAKQGGRVSVMTVNNAYQKAPWTDVHIACNDDWWNYYWPRSAILREMGCPKYTWYRSLADKYGIQYVKAIVKDGLSTDPRIVHINHGSGPMAINLAVHLGVKRLLLIGHDMKFAPNYNGRQQKIGSSKRHFFGEYPKELQHWPSVKVGKTKPGALDGLIESYDRMVPDLKKIGMKVINCTPNSVLTSFSTSTLEKEL